MSLEYIIARGLGKEDLESEVRHWLDEGYEPLGPPFAAQEYLAQGPGQAASLTWFFYQAMTRRMTTISVQEPISDEAMEALRRAFLDLHESGYLEEILRKADEVLENG
ncbi:MAG TPA: hypothetical protein P5234_10680 [Thermoanaerobaculaceae bacterium]|nr:hypothetical protein [Thermoanaerobaculaceae bacterium]HRS16694.1 hypothetical protein [Thermoanaerobaculaceae bacterium]